jgi:hypothetical protein
MGRADRVSQSAAIRYQHATDKRDRVLADAWPAWRMGRDPATSAQRAEVASVGLGPTGLSTVVKIGSLREGPSVHAEVNLVDG